MHRCITVFRCLIEIRTCLLYHLWCFLICRRSSSCVLLLSLSLLFFSLCSYPFFVFVFHNLSCVSCVLFQLAEINFKNHTTDEHMLVRRVYSPRPDGNQDEISEIKKKRHKQKTVSGELVIFDAKNKMRSNRLRAFAHILHTLAVVNWWKLRIMLVRIYRRFHMTACAVHTNAPNQNDGRRRKRKTKY